MAPRVLGITLARAGSKGVPHKNMRLVAGRPLLVWTIDEVEKSNLVDRYIVSSDDPEIRQLAAKYAPFQRPAFLAGDDTPSQAALIHALDWAEEADQELYDIVCDIRCTNPLKLVDDIDGCIRMLIETGADVVCGVSLLEDHHPSRIKTMLEDGRLIDVWPEPPDGNRQSLRPPVYIRNGSIYAAWADRLREGIHFSGGYVCGYEMPPERSVNVDSELDILVCDALLRQRGLGS